MLDIFEFEKALNLRKHAHIRFWVEAKHKCQEDCLPTQLHLVFGMCEICDGFDIWKTKTTQVSICDAYLKIKQDTFFRGFRPNGGLIQTIPFLNLFGCCMCLYMDYTLLDTNNQV